MRPPILRVLTYLPGFCGLVVLIYGGFVAAIELLTNVGVLHNRNLWGSFHQGLWFWCLLLALMTAASTISWLATRSLRGRATSQERPA